MKNLLFFLLFSSLCYSQNLSFIYESKFKVRSTAEAFVENSVLDITGNSSIFRSQTNKDTDSLSLLKKNGMEHTGVEHQYYVKKTVQGTNKIIFFLDKNYLLPIDEKLDWKISSENKKIANYTAQKAEVDYGGRHWIAWFTSDLPFNDGPYIFRGLPGLIISIQDEKGDYSFNLIQVKKNSNAFEARTKTIKIDWNQYEKLAKSYYNDPLDLNSKSGRRVYFTDPNGNQQDIKVFAKSEQESVLKDDNPIELNHKIQYK